MLERDLDKEAIIIQQALRMRAPIPEKIANAPELGQGLEYYLEIYLDLASDKSVGFGEGPIPWSAIDRYARRYGIVGEEFERLVTLIRATDAQILQEKQKKHRRDLNKNKPKTMDKPRYTGREKHKIG